MVNTQFPAQEQFLLTKKEIKKVKTFYVANKLIKPFLVSTIMLLVLWLIFSMISDLVFQGASEFFEYGIYAFLVLIVIVATIMLSSYAISAIGTHTKKWKEIEEKANNYIVTDMQTCKDINKAKIVSLLGLNAFSQIMRRNNNDVLNVIGDISSVISTIGAFSLMLDVTNYNNNVIVFISKVYDIKLPSFKLLRNILALVPLIILITFYSVGFAQASENIKKETEIASASVEAVQSVFDEKFKEVSADEPLNEYDKDGYEINGRILDKNEEAVAYVIVTINNEGNISKITYEIDENPNLNKKDNIEYVNTLLNVFNDAIKESNVKCVNEKYLDFRKLTDDFEKTYCNNNSKQEYISYDDEESDLHISFSSSNEHYFYCELG